MLDRDVEAAPPEQIIKSISERRLFEPRVDSQVLLRVGLVAFEIAAVLQPRNRLYLAKLRRLKSARGSEVISEGEEIHRRHRLKNTYLVYEHALNLYAPAQQAVRGERFVFVEPLNYRIK